VTVGHGGRHDEKPGPTGYNTGMIGPGTKEIVHTPDGGLLSGLAVRAGRAPVFVLVCLVRFYQVGIAPLLIGTCKFCPSCSEYFIEALQLHGPFRGSRLGVKRLLRCHPFSPGGIDPVPPGTGTTDAHR